MTIGGALSELNNLLNADDIPCYYKPSIKAVMDTIALEQGPKTGHWEHGKELCREYQGKALVDITYENWHCSNCHCVIKQSIKPKWNYCPSCGADMREVEE